MVIGIMRSLSARNSAARNRAAKAKVLLCVLALGALLASPLSAQYLETTIKLPDTLGWLSFPWSLARACPLLS